ncbi:class I SAM-dependent methyltransferase [Candidatus Woesearchaeota archaeon]|nr:class I SAM-dependent methyltransferase [Candidatus Woesearchaeota archaeon]
MFSADYQKTNTKPDKLYSILPTVLSLLGQIKGKTIVDVGCGTGFFTNSIVQRGATHVYGIDISSESLKIARRNSVETRGTVEYILLDIFEDKLPVCDSICFPFVLNLAKSVHDMLRALEICFFALRDGGNIVLVVDLPINNKSHSVLQKQKEFGAVKTLLGARKNGTSLQVDLYNRKKKVYSFQSRFFTSKCIEQCLSRAGFQNILWHSPIISKKGFEYMPDLFWEGYQDICEIGYITALKVSK